MCHDVTFVYNVDVPNVSAYFALTFFHGRKKKLYKISSLKGCIA